MNFISDYMRRIAGPTEEFDRQNNITADRDLVIQRIRDYNRLTRLSIRLDLVDDETIWGLHQAALRDQRVANRNARQASAMTINQNQDQTINQNQDQTINLDQNLSDLTPDSAESIAGRASDEDNRGSDGTANAVGDPAAATPRPPRVAAAAAPPAADQETSHWVLRSTICSPA